ncbi:hypothetical protein TNCV_3927591 [Trichonephila clavipes]|nr:hypothetical protein TNCV_3927591 [Trichonephila clavipes]
MSSSPRATEDPPTLEGTDVIKSVELKVLPSAWCGFGERSASSVSVGQVSQSIHLIQRIIAARSFAG